MISLSAIMVNGRYSVHKVTGIQRVATELVSRLKDRVEIVAPSVPVRGVVGHAWEQVVLPIRTHGSVLWSPSGIGPISKSRHIVTIHDLSVLDHPEWFANQYAAWYNFALPRLLARATRIIAVSRTTADRVGDLEGVDPARIHVIPNGVSKHFHPRTQDEIRPVLDQLGIPTQRYVLFVGSYEPRKNVSNLLRAWHNVDLTVRRGVSLVIAGPRGRAAVFKNASSSAGSGDVHFTGFVDDRSLPALYSGAQALVYPSLYEGFGLPVIEAMACGAPVVASKLSSLPEVCGDAALLVDPHDIQAMSQALETVLVDESLRNELRGRGHHRAQGYTWEKAAAKTLEVLSEVAES